MPSLSLKERIQKNVGVDGNGCWIWLRAKERKGYGRMTMHREVGVQTSEYAHRVSYEAFVGKISEGLQVDHLCKVTSCVNPEHLEPVTGKENKHRSNLKQLWKAKKALTHCVHSHEYTPENTMLKKDIWGNFNRNCRECPRIRNRRQVLA